MAAEYATIQGRNLEYIRLPGTAPQLVFLHEGPGSISLWRVAIQGIDDEYRALAQLEPVAAKVSGPVDLLKLPDCRHSPHRDQPGKTLAAMVHFVRRLTAAGHGAMRSGVS